MEKSTPALAHQTPEGIDGEKYEPLEILIEPFIHLSLNALPAAVRKRVDEARFLSSFWDSRPDQRRPLAQQYDIQHDPKFERENEYFFALGCQRYEIESKKRKWELWAPQNITEEDIKEKKLSALTAQLDALQKQMRAPYTAPEPPAPPVAAVGAFGGVEPDKAGPLPLPLTTSDIAFCFAGLKWQTEQAWKKPLGDKPKWLQSCIAIPGVQGVSETRWNPVYIGAALVRDGEKLNRVRGRFQSNHLLTPWLEEWKTYEADNITT